MEKQDIVVTYGQNIRKMVTDILEAIDLASMIGDKKKRIGLKPNLVVASPADGGGTTHSEMLEATIMYLQAKGFENFVIIEGSWVGDRTDAAYRICGFYAMAKKYGVDIVDTQKDTYRAYDCSGMKLNICDSAMALDFLINYPVLKGHCQTVMTCALKNMKGLIPNKEKRHFHTMGLDRPIAHLNTRIKGDLILVDGICGDLDFEEGGNPVPMNRIYAAVDPVLCDTYACELMGIDPSEVRYIGLAEKLGVGSSKGARIIELNKGESTGNPGKTSRKVARLAQKADAKDACSACYGSLIHALARMDEYGQLERIPGKISIGQGFKGETGSCGIGNCTCKFDQYVKGCPPKASDILEFLKNL